MIHWYGTSEETDSSQNGTSNETYTLQYGTRDEDNPTDPMSNTTVGAPGCITIQFQEFLPWFNPDNIVSSDVRDITRRLKDVLFLPILFLIGGPANVINMAVFYKQGLKERITVCLFALSLADGLYLVSNMLLYGEQLYLQFTTKEM